MTDLLKNPIFHDEMKACYWLEAFFGEWSGLPALWQRGSGQVTKLEGKAHRPGVYQCNEAVWREQFTVRVSTVFESSKILLSKWLTALFLMTASKKGLARGGRTCSLAQPPS